MKKIFLILWLMAVVGCQHQNGADYEQKLSAWIGMSQSALFSQWGMPNSRFVIDHSTYVVTYNRRFSKRTLKQDEFYQSTLSRRAMEIGPQYGHATSPALYYCKTSFTIQNGVVVDYSFNGDACG